jgi:hypothetical protein
MKTDTETLIAEISAAINANNGQCSIIESALINAMDFAMSKTPQDEEPLYGAAIITRQQKRKYILDYAPVLKDLAEGYEKCASRIDDMPDHIFEAMFEVAVFGDEANGIIADAIEKAEKERQ